MSAIVKITCPQCSYRMAARKEVADNPDAIIKCINGGHEFKLKDAILEIREARPLGWLVIHDENTRAQSIDIMKRVSVVGRADPDRPCDIMIETDDKYMSRNHFRIEIKEPNKKNECLAIISDAGSKGGTYIETKMLENYKREVRRLAEGEEVYLSDGAIILAGKTKMFYKSVEVAGSKKEASETIHKQAYTKTVIR